MKLDRTDPLSKAFVRVILPRSDDDGLQFRPFDIIISDLDVLAELNSESKVNQPFAISHLHS